MADSLQHIAGACSRGQNLNIGVEMAFGLWRTCEKTGTAERGADSGR